MKDDKSIPKETIFEYNCIQVDGITPGGCPVCPTCKEPAYEKDRCVFCEQIFKEIKPIKLGNKNKTGECGMCGIRTKKLYPRVVGQVDFMICERCKMIMD